MVEAAEAATDATLHVFRRRLLTPALSSEYEAPPLCSRRERRRRASPERREARASAEGGGCALPTLLVTGCSLDQRPSRPTRTRTRRDSEEPELGLFLQEPSYSLGSIYALARARHIY